MSSLEGIKVPLREKSGRRLIALSVTVFLIMAVIIFAAALVLCYYKELNLMDQYVREVPKILENRAQKFETRSNVYKSDVLARSALGVKLYGEEDGLKDAERLELVRATVSAASVSLADGNGQFLATAGPIAPEETIREYIRPLEAGNPTLVTYPSRTQNGDAAEGVDITMFVKLPLDGMDRSLVFEYNCDSLVDVRNDLSDWSDILKRMLSGVDAISAVRTYDGELEIFPTDGYTQDQLARLRDELNAVFDNSGSFRERAGKAPSKEIKLLGESYLAAMLHYPEEKADVLMAGNFGTLVQSSFYTATAISSIIALGMILFQLYVFRRRSKEEPAEDRGPAFRKQVYRSTAAGMFAVLAVTGVFIVLMMMLENRATSALIAITKRETVEYDIDWHEQQQGLIRKTYSDIYKTRAQILAEFVTQHPEYGTHDGLTQLNALAGTDYLMLFDRSGREHSASNSYTNFTVDENLGEEFRAVLLGYPYMVGEPAADPYTGQVQLDAAILLKDEGGQPEGFLLAVFDAETLQNELTVESPEGAVNTFAVQDGNFAAIVNNEDGRFLAHTDPKMIGQRAEDSLEGYEPGKEIEGFLDYKEENMYMSGSVKAGKSILFSVPANPDRSVRIGTIQMIALVMILLLVYLFGSSVLCAQLVEDARLKLPTKYGKNSLMVFANGYVIFLSLLAICTAFLSAHAMWPAFDFVFSRKWSNGVNLFSIWAAVLIVAGTLSAVIIARALLSIVESRLSPRSRTLTRLIDSVICYIACIFVLFYVLTIFGVNTKTLLASAGILSIAVGMGAQSMAADLLAGFFMMLEGSVHVGDYVCVGGVSKGNTITGYVTNMGIRTMEITDEKGDFMILNNSKINNLLNMSRKKIIEEEEREEQENEGISEAVSKS